MNNKKPRNLLLDLAYRGVFKAVGIFVAVAWGSSEIFYAAHDRLGWPIWLGDMALILLLTGLPFIVLLSWAFDLTGSGVKRMEPGSLSGKAIIAAVLTIVLGVSAIWIVRQGENPATPNVVGVENGARPVIAVLPFQDFVRDENSAVLVSAFADELINRINAHPDLVALTLATMTNPAAMDADGQAAADLPADYFLEGSFRPASVGTELKVRLVDRSGVVRWKDEQVRDFSDFRNALDTQEYLAGQVTATLGSELTGRDYCATSAHSEAVSLFVEAKKMFSLRGPDNVAGAALKLERAVELDPEFARAFDLLAIVYERFPSHVSRDPSAYNMTEEQLRTFWDTQPQAEAARKALDLCPNLAGSYVAFELSAPVEHHLADLVDFLNEGLRRDPSAVSLLDRSVYVLLDMGHLDQAEQAAREYLLREPLNPRASGLLSFALRAKGRASEALALERRGVELGAFEGFEEFVLMEDYYVTGDLEAFLTVFPEDYDPGALGVGILDHRLFAQLPDETAQRKLREQFLAMAKIESGEAFTQLVGMRGAYPWLFELGDPDLAWDVIEQFAEIAPAGALPYGVWFHRFRHWFGNQRLVELMDQWTSEHRIFWDRHGPPDDCSWEEGVLSCEFAEQP